MSTIEASLQLEIAQYQAALRKAQGEIERFRTRAKKNGDGLGAAMFGGIAKRAAALGPILLAGFGAKEIVGAVVNMEQLEKRMITLEGSVEGANRRLKELRDLSELPGLDFQTMVEGDTLLRSTGISAERSARMITEVGNAIASAGGGKEELLGVLKAFSQISGKGKIFAEEINQIAERLPQVRGVLKDAFGTTDAQQIAQLGLTVEEVFDRITDAMSKGPRALGGLSDDLNKMGAVGVEVINDLAGPLVKDLIPAFRELTDLLKENKEGLQNMGKEAALGMRYLMDLQGVTDSWMQGKGGLFDLFAQAGYDRVIEGERKRLEKEKKIADLRAGVGGGADLKPLPTIDAGSDDAGKAQKKSLAEEARLREQIAEIQRRARLDSMPAEERALEIAREISRLAVEFGRNGPETETARLEVEKKILELKNQQAAAQKQAAEEAKDETDRAADAAQRLSIFQRELDIAEARAAGENDLADTMQRQLDIAQLQARLVEEMRLGEEEALALAERHVDAAAELNAKKSKVARYDEEGRRADGRRKIQGYSRERQGSAEEASARAQARIDDARKKREIPSGLDAFAAQPGLRDRMAGGGMFLGLEGAFGPGGTHAANPLAETAAANAAKADQPTTGGVEGKFDELIAVVQEGLLGDG
jgi:tape measure domain-containing protein